jgi:hypothetical protein
VALPAQSASESGGGFLKILLWTLMLSVLAAGVGFLIMRNRSRRSI